MSENIVKQVCKELGITQKELAEIMGVAEGTVNRWSSHPQEVATQAKTTFNLILENHELKKAVNEYENFFYIMNQLQTKHIKR